MEPFVSTQTIFEIVPGFRSQDYEKQINMITEFLKRAGLPNLPKTATKLRGFTHFIDDKAWNCEANKGMVDKNIDI